MAWVAEEVSLLFCTRRFARSQLPGSRYVSSHSLRSAEGLLPNKVPHQTVKVHQRRSPAASPVLSAGVLGLVLVTRRLSCLFPSRSGFPVRGLSSQCRSPPPQPLALPPVCLNLAPPESGPLACLTAHAPLFDGKMASMHLGAGWMMWVRVLVTVALLLDDCKGEGCNCSAGILLEVPLVGITNLAST